MGHTHCMSEDACSDQPLVPNTQHPRYSEQFADPVPRRQMNDDYCETRSIAMRIDCEKPLLETSATRTCPCRYCGYVQSHAPFTEERLSVHPQAPENPFVNVQGGATFAQPQHRNPSSTCPARRPTLLVRENTASHFCRRWS